MKYFPSLETLLNDIKKARKSRSQQIDFQAFLECHVYVKRLEFADTKLFIQPVNVEIKSSKSVKNYSASFPGSLFIASLFCCYDITNELQRFKKSRDQAAMAASTNRRMCLKESTKYNVVSFEGDSSFF